MNNNTNKILIPNTLGGASKLKHGHLLLVINNRNKKILAAFGKHLRKLRLERGISQEELNFRAELSKNMVGMIERGEVNSTLTTIEALAKGLELPKKKLLDYD